MEHLVVHLAVTHVTLLSRTIQWYHTSGLPAVSDHLVYLSLTANIHPFSHVGLFVCKYMLCTLRQIYIENFTLPGNPIHFLSSYPCIIVIECQTLRGRNLKKVYILLQLSVFFLKIRNEFNILILFSWGDCIILWKKNVADAGSSIHSKGKHFLSQVIHKLSQNQVFRDFNV